MQVLPLSLKTVVLLLLTSGPEVFRSSVVRLTNLTSEKEDFGLFANGYKVNEEKMLIVVLVLHAKVDILGTKVWRKGIPLVKWDMSK